MDDDEKKSIRDDFHDAVTMTPHELEQWLETEDAKEVGQKSSDGAESVGHESGRKIVSILRTKVADLDDDDYAHMKKVTGYVHRHRAQGPEGDVHDSKWRFSLMNWGNDPEKEK